MADASSLFKTFLLFMIFLDESKTLSLD